MIYINGINKKLKNGKFVPFRCNTKDDAIKLEKILVSNGYRWPINEKYLIHSIHFNNYIIMDVNYRGSGILTKSRTESIIHENDDIINVDDYLLKNLFKNIPSYTPKKIYRNLI